MTRADTAERTLNLPEQKTFYHTMLQIIYFLKMKLAFLLSQLYCLIYYEYSLFPLILNSVHLKNDGGRMISVSPGIHLHTKLKKFCM